MTNESVRGIKKAQKESLFFQAISHLFHDATLDAPSLAPLFVTRVELSPDYGMARVYFYSSEGKAKFQELFETLKLYKPSLRKALASKLNQRYTPDLFFAFDDTVEKQEHIENLFEKIKTH